MQVSWVEVIPACYNLNIGLSDQGSSYMINDENQRCNSSSTNKTYFSFRGPKSGENEFILKSAFKNNREYDFSGDNEIINDKK